MKRFKVVLVDVNGKTIPAWVLEALDKEGIEFVARECGSTEDLARHAGDADVVWVWGSRVVTAESLAGLPQCGAIIRTGSGTDNVPVDEATRRGIVVANTPEAHNDAVSNHAIALLLAIIRDLPQQDRSVRAGQWYPTSWHSLHLHGRTLGLVGFGLIGRLVARKMRGFDLSILAYDPVVSAEAMAAESVRPADVDTILSESDFVFLHCPLTRDTYHLIGERELRRMKPSAILINTARGPVVDEPALVRALTEGWIAAAGLDVLEQEPPDPDNPLFKLANVLVTPHAAGHSDEDREASWRLSTDTAIALARGRWPRSYVNRSVKPRLNLS
jgi:D-3-phosphoglycerate dehydrogenase / 2-oxoglutarate reductase